MIDRILMHIGKNRAELDVGEQVWFIPNTFELFGRTAQSH